MYKYLSAAAVGAKKVLVKTGWGEPSLTSHRHLWAHVEPDYIAVDIVDATQWVLAVIGLSDYRTSEE